jgi:hypothetical protein
MHRYRKEVKIWKEKKEREGELGAQKQSLNASFSSHESNDSEFELANLPFDSTGGGDAWQLRKQSGNNNDSYNSSFSSIDSYGSQASASVEPMPIRNMIAQQQHMQKQQQQLQMQIQQQQQQLQMLQLQQQQQQHGAAMPTFTTSGSQGFGTMTGFRPMTQLGHSSFNNSVQSLQPEQALMPFVSQHTSVSDYHSSGTSSHPSSSFAGSQSSGFAHGSYSSGFGHGSQHSQQHAGHNSGGMSSSYTSQAGQHSYGPDASTSGLMASSTVTDGMSPHRAAFFNDLAHQNAAAFPSQSTRHAGNMLNDDSSEHLGRYLGGMDLGQQQQEGGGNHDDQNKSRSV